MPYGHLKTTRDREVERLALNRFEASNALRADVIAELTAWANRVCKSGDLRVVVQPAAEEQEGLRAFLEKRDPRWVVDDAESEGRTSERSARIPQARGAGGRR